MNCEQIKKQIPDWLDGETETNLAEIIENHIGDCDSCRQEVAFWKNIGDAFQEDSGNIKAPVGFADAVMARLPKQQDSGFKKITAGWRRGLAAAAAFLLVATGSAAGYFQWGLNKATHIVEHQPDIVAIQEPANNGKEPGPPADPGNNVPGGVQPVDNGTENTGMQQSGNSQPKATPDDPPEQPSIEPSGDSDNITNSQRDIINPGELALMNTNMDRVLERTLLQLKVEDFDAAQTQALDYIYGSNARYEIIASEDTDTGNQESLKIVVDNSQAVMLLDNLTALGQVVTRDKTRSDITADYNKKVEQVSSLKGQLTASDNEQEREQLQVRITGIMAYLKAWDQEAKNKTIILLLEN
ncbi:MAG: zf-HC2 domain-containing protein [Firmicutes bacterium]|nr:zf-HC2 domain-containing protein [Bacillota bacterium]